MTLFTLLCPHCGFSSAVQKDKIPPRAITATCPDCGASFPFSLQSALQHHPKISPPGAAVPVLPTGAPSSAASSSAADRPRRTTHRFVFTGNAREYFGIWMVNLLLKVVTMGLYSAWAKVRKRRYFYGNTLLDQASFDYVADPWVIFRGWCLGVLLLVVYSLGSRLSPTLAGVFGVALFLAIPWVIVRSRMFNARNSSHRNIRFTFRPNYREGYLVYAGLPLLLPFTLGLIAPYMLYRQKKFQVENSCFGQTPFTFIASLGDFYRLFLRIGLGLLLIFALLAGGVALLLLLTGGFSPEPAFLAALAPLVFLAVAVIYFFFVIYVQTRLTNLTWNSTRLADAQFVSTLRTRDMAWLYLSGAVAIFCTFGLMIPWVAVRLARYRAEQMVVSTVGELRTLAAGQAEIGAAGEELGDLFGIEVGLGVG